MIRFEKQPHTVQTDLIKDFDRQFIYYLQQFHQLSDPLDGKLRTQTQFDLKCQHEERQEKENKNLESEDKKKEAKTFEDRMTNRSKDRAAECEKEVRTLVILAKISR